MDFDQFDLRLRPQLQGGVTLASGFRASGVKIAHSASVHDFDLALVCVDAPVAAAAVFTNNRLETASVTVSRQHLKQQDAKTVQAVLMHAGIANGGLGDVGLATAEEACAIAAQIAGCEPEQILLATTGKLACPIAREQYENGISAAFNQLSAQGGTTAAAALAAPEPKLFEYAVSFTSQTLAYAGCTFTVGGMCRRAGNLVLLTTDAPVSSECLSALFTPIVETSFKQMYDGFNNGPGDSYIMLASGVAAPDVAPIEQGSEAAAELSYVISAVCEHLLRQMMAEAAGSGSIVMVQVQGSVSVEQAEAAARALVLSRPVMQSIVSRCADLTALLAALGRSGSRVDVETLSITLADMPIFSDGAPIPFDEDELKKRLDAREMSEIRMLVDLGIGDFSARLWTTDAIGRTAN
ncbi:bifunctional ornithine acetyltransferase/N-acetylglutamate synthase [Collinsella sp. zg1085]|uniref:bifunctional ornithine acetyltransferase/N-acetylglutamate synthase n=1 Tax=Collinsella sp. zg1085 TaxID=2844380 RepID=UPI001C0B4452|nr:bifunctional ornithine acetyltransferase/N-acetylglutamate synthase [Collinsella sp. zg1085]QWT17850.1 bifunctional ornithine acetyltransferase/N-acetylglutamate synthase [Collinsella sp. zg1085]